MEDSLNLEAVIDKSSNMTLLEKGRDLLSQDYVSTLFQLAKGPALIFAAATGWAPAMPIAGAALIAVGVSRVQYNRNTFKKRTLEQYNEEIAVSMGKPAKKLTLGDLDAYVQKTKASGKENALTLEIDAIDAHARFNSATSALSTIVMTAFTFVATSFIPIEVFKEGLGLLINSAVGKLVFDNVSKAMTNISGEPPRPGLNRLLRGMNDNLRYRPIEPEYVMAALIEADPALKENIKIRYGKEYRDLPLAAKTQITDAHEPQYHARALAEAINTQRLRPTELGFIAYGQRSGLAERQHLKPDMDSIARGLVEMIKNPEHKKHVERLMLSRVETPLSMGMS